MELSFIIGRNIRFFREKLRMNQENLAEFLGLNSHASVSYYESGEREISLSSLEKLADLFGVEIADLLEEDAEQVKLDTAFAFRQTDITAKDLESIAQFKKIVKNYLKIDRLEHGK